MEFNAFDIIATVIILLLGLKGILNGFFKEVFGLVGIIGGIFIASRVGDSVGQYLSDTIFKFDNTSAISFTGFLATLLLFWALMIVAGLIFKKLSSLSGLGAVDKILGFIFGASKFFLIAAVIAHAMFNINAVKSLLEEPMKNSFLFPVLVEVGGVIMKLDPIVTQEEITNALKEQQNELQQSIEQTIQNSTLDIVQDAKNNITNALEKEASQAEENNQSE
jgi:membrane protein required for colicin V production